MNKLSISINPKYCFEFKDMKDHAVIINSFSKKFSMTGWRIGYAAAPEKLVSAMTKLQENMVKQKRGSSFPR